MADEIEKKVSIEKDENLLWEISEILKNYPDGLEEKKLVSELIAKKGLGSEEAEEYTKVIEKNLFVHTVEGKLHNADDRFYLSEAMKKEKEAGTKEFLNIKELFNEIKSTYARNVEFVEYQAYDFFPCWIIGTYIFNDFDSYPYVYLHAPKRSGKTKTLSLTSKLSHEALSSVNFSQASVYRLIEEKDPTLLIDEADYLGKEDKAELYKILNAGYKKGAYVYRCENVGKKIETRKWNVYCPKMLASVDELKDQFIDRCITFHLLRSRNKEISNTIIKENVDDRGIKWDFYKTGLEVYALKLKEEILKNLEDIDKDEKMEEIIGRDRELWLPILAIGKTLGNDVYANIINLALDKVAITKEQEKETLENAIITELLEMVSEDSWIPVKDVYDVLKPKPEYNAWLNIRTIGKVMKRLNFLLRKTITGSTYYVKRNDLEDLAKRYGVDL